MFGRKENRNIPIKNLMDLRDRFRENEGAVRHHCHRGEIYSWWIQDVETHTLMVYASRGGVHRHQMLGMDEVERNGGMKHIAEIARRLVNDLELCARGQRWESG